MASESITYVGKKELIKDREKKEVEYKRADVSVNTFYGGIERGKCLQISLDGDHIQLPSIVAERLANDILRLLK